MLIDNKDGTVTDTGTGLMWKQDINDKMTWRKALEYCKKIDLAGHKDWRLPTIKELIALVEYGKHNPSIDETVFPITVSRLYWSSTAYTDSAAFAWIIDFYSGGGKPVGKSSRYYTRAVRTID